MEEIRRRRKALLAWVLTIAMLVGIGSNNTWVMKAYAANVDVTMIVKFYTDNTLTTLAGDIFQETKQSGEEYVSSGVGFEVVPPALSDEYSTGPYNYAWSDGEYKLLTPNVQNTVCAFQAGETILQLYPALNKNDMYAAGYTFIRIPAGDETGNYTFTVTDDTNVTLGREYTDGSITYKEYYYELPDGVSAVDSSEVVLPQVTNSAGKTATWRGMSGSTLRSASWVTLSADSWVTMLTVDFNGGTYEGETTYQIEIYDTDYSALNMFKEVVPEGPMGTALAGWVYVGADGVEQVVTPESSLKSQASHTVKAVWGKATLTIGPAAAQSYSEPEKVYANDTMTESNTYYYSKYNYSGTYMALRAQGYVLDENDNQTAVSGKMAYTVSASPKTEAQLKASSLSDWYSVGGCFMPVSTTKEMDSDGVTPIGWQENIDGTYYVYLTFIDEKTSTIGRIYAVTNGADTSYTTIGEAAGPNGYFISSGKIVIDSEAPALAVLEGTTEVDQEVDTTYTAYGSSLKIKVTDTGSGIDKVTMIDSNSQETLLTVGSDGYYTVPSSAEAVVVSDKAGNESGIYTTFHAVELAGSGADYMEVTGVTADSDGALEIALAMKNSGYSFRNSTVFFNQADSVGEEAWDNEEQMGPKGQIVDGKIRLQLTDGWEALFETGSMTILTSKWQNLNDGARPTISMIYNDKEYATADGSLSNETVYGDDIVSVDVSVSDAGTGIQKFFYFVNDKADNTGYAVEDADGYYADIAPGSSEPVSVQVPEGCYLHVYAFDGNLMSSYQRFGPVAIDNDNPTVSVPVLGDFMFANGTNLFIDKYMSSDSDNQQLQLIINEANLYSLSINGTVFYSGWSASGSTNRYLMLLEKGVDKDYVVIATDKAGNECKITIAVDYQYVADLYIGDEAVTLDPDMGDRLGLIRAVIAKYGEAFALPTASRSGYTFGGWYDNESFSGNPMTSVAAKGAVLSTDGRATYYAKWEKSVVGLTGVTGVQKLWKGTRYRITDKSTFKISGDATVYQGNVDFYTAADSEYTFE